VRMAGASGACSMSPPLGAIVASGKAESGAGPIDGREG
jgi:hypothetical protein